MRSSLTHRSFQRAARWVRVSVLDLGPHELDSGGNPTLSLSFALSFSSFEITAWRVALRTTGGELCNYGGVAGALLADTAVPPMSQRTGAYWIL